MKKVGYTGRTGCGYRLRPGHFVEHYLKGAGKSFEGAYSFAHHAPAASMSLNDHDSLFDIDQRTTGTHADAKSTVVALVLIDLWHERQYSLPPYFLYYIPVLRLSL